MNNTNDLNSVTGGSASINTNGPVDTTGQWYISPSQPSICPGCGRCKDCGQPYPIYGRYYQYDWQPKYPWQYPTFIWW